MSSSSSRFRASSTKYRECDIYIAFPSTSLHFCRWNLAFLTIVPLTGLYPFMKRITYFPQVWLGVNLEVPDTVTLFCSYLQSSKGITLNAPVLIASAIFLNKVSWAAMILAAGGFTYVNSSCSEMILLTSGPVFSWTMWYGMSKKKNFLIGLRILNILFRYHIRMPRQERRCKGRRKNHHPYPSKPC